MSPAVDIPVLVRAARQTDIPLVMSSWLHSYRFKARSSNTVCGTCRREVRLFFGGEANTHMHDSDYFDLQGKRIERLLKAGAPVVVLCHAEATDVVYSWACLGVSPLVLHYVWTDKEHRGRGFAKRLVEGRKIVTHMTDSRRADSFARWASRAEMRYQPHLLDGGA